MASTIGISGPHRHTEDGILKGARRSRISFHLRTFRVRRWLLVQLISVPVTEEIEDDDFAPKAQFRLTNQHTGVVRKLADEYKGSRPLHNWA